MKRTLIAIAFAAALPAFAQQVAPPAPGAPREVSLPQPAEKTLANGLRVVVVPKHDIPLVAAELLIRTGGASDPEGLDGLAQLTAALVTKGTTTKKAEELARGVEALGATLESNAGWDSSAIDLSVMSTNLAKAMEFVGDTARNATFAAEEIDLERAQMVDSLQVALSQPRTLANIVAARLVFGSTPYGHNVSGTPSSLEKITREDVLRFYRTHYRPANAVLVIAGDVKAPAAFELAQKVFGSWKDPEGVKAKTPAYAVPAEQKRRVVVVDLPEAGQASVVVTRPGIRRADPAYFRALVANSVLGGGYSARLNQEIRIKRGLSYGAGSSFSPRVGVGPFAARTDTKNESAAEVADIIVSQMTGLSAADVPATELTPRKAVLIGEFAQGLEATSGIVGELSALALYGLPLTEINKYISGVESVKAEDVKAFASAGMKGSDATIVIVGDASKFLEPLKKQFGEVEVIPASELDIASPSLRVRKEKE